MAGRQGSTWQDQWARIGRWRARVVASRDTVRTDDLGTEGYRDEVFALFQAVWHLKDWFVNDEDDTLVDVTDKSMWGWLNENGSRLWVAAEVANGSKHMRLRRGTGAEQTRNDVRLHIGEGVQHTFYVQDESRNVDEEAVALANQCLDEWRTFLDEHNLVEPAPA